MNKEIHKGCYEGGSAFSRFCGCEKELDLSLNLGQTSRVLCADVCSCAQTSVW